MGSGIKLPPATQVHCLADKILLFSTAQRSGKHNTVGSRGKAASRDAVEAGYIHQEASIRPDGGRTIFGEAPDGQALRCIPPLMAMAGFT